MGNTVQVFDAPSLRVISCYRFEMHMSVSETAKSGSINTAQQMRIKEIAIAAKHTLTYHLGTKKYPIRSTRGERSAKNVSKFLFSDGDDDDDGRRSPKDVSFSLSLVGDVQSHKKMMMSTFLSRSRFSSGSIQIERGTATPGDWNSGFRRPTRMLVITLTVHSGSRCFGSSSGDSHW